MSNPRDDNQQNRNDGTPHRTKRSLDSLRSFSSDTPNQSENQRAVATPEQREQSFSEKLYSDAGWGLLLVAIYAVFFISLLILRSIRNVDDATIFSFGIFVVLPVITMWSLFVFYRRQNQHFTPNPNYLTDLDPREADAYPRAAQRVYEPAKPPRYRGDACRRTRPRRDFTRAAYRHRRHRFLGTKHRSRAPHRTRTH